MPKLFFLMDVQLRKSWSVTARGVVKAGRISITLGLSSTLQTCLLLVSDTRDLPGVHLRVCWTVCW